jgi:electron transport complex protein RnfB
MHTIIEEECTGCERCLAVCPVDCIHLENTTGQATGWDAWSKELALNARQRYEQQTLRHANLANNSSTQDKKSSLKQSAVQAALERAELRQQVKR